MLWLLLQDTAFILECQDAFGPKVPIKSSVSPERENDPQSYGCKGLFLFSCQKAEMSPLCTSATTRKHLPLDT